MSSGPSSPMRESHAIALIGSVQFVNVLDFMMVMPLGPDLAESLAIPTSKIGAIAGAYTLAAAVSGLVGGAMLDRFDRRRALFATLVGLSLGTLAGGFADSFATLVASRLLAGAFGGPATAVSIAVLADLVPAERRGRAMGRVMGAFSVASVFGVPTGLELARRFGFRAPFFAVGALALAIAALTFVVMPPLRAHLSRSSDAPRTRVLDGTALLSLANSLLVFSGNFALIPNFAVYLQYNLGYPRDRLFLVYAVGGAASFFIMRVAGYLTDRHGAAPTILVGTGLYVAVVASLFHLGLLSPYPMIAFAAFMATNSVRFVGLNALGSRVPVADARARFLSMQNATQHVAATLGAYLASEVLTERAGGALVGMRTLASATIVCALIVPWIAYVVERRVRTREHAELGMDAAEAPVRVT